MSPRLHWIRESFAGEGSRFCYPSRVKAVALACLTLALCFLSAEARAQCSPVDLGIGAIAAERCETGSESYVVARVELRSPDVRLVVSAPTERGSSPDEWINTITGGVLAVQAGPFEFAEQRPLGFTVGQGVEWNDTADDGAMSVMAFSDRNAGVFVPPEQVVTFEEWMYSAVSGVPVLIEGRAMPCEGSGCDLAPRTGLGLSADAGTLVVVAARGYLGGAAGIADSRLAELLAEAGAASGMRTGSGATSMMIRPSGALVPASEPTYRPTAALLAILDRRTGVTGNLIGVVEDVADASRVGGAAIRIETLDGEPFQTATANGTGLFQLDLPPRSYIVWAESSNHVAGCRICDVVGGAMRWCSFSLRTSGAPEQCVPEGFGIDAGPWPEPAPPEAGAPDAGSRPSDPPGSCSVVATLNRRTGSWTFMIPLVLLLIRRARR